MRLKFLPPQALSFGLRQERTGASNSDDISASKNPSYRYDKHTLKWTTSKEIGLIFVAVYRSLLHLSWVDKLVDNIKTIFVELYGDQLRKPYTTLIECEFDEFFDQQVQKLENISLRSDSQFTDSSQQHGESLSSTPEHFLDEPLQLPGLISKEQIDEVSRVTTFSGSSTQIPVTPKLSNSAGHLITGKARPGSKSSRRARKAANSPSANSSDELKSKKNRVEPKKGRKWDANGLPDESSDITLDYSSIPDGSSVEQSDSKEKSLVLGKVDKSWGSKTSNGKFVLKDLDDHITSILAAAKASENDKISPNGIMGSSLSAVGGFFRNVVGGKILTKQDLDKAMKSMEEHLLKKNVAREAAIRLCEGVERELIGVKTGNFESIQSKIQTAMESSLKKILTPTSSLDLLREIDAIASPKSLLQTRRPYVISIVGVNGVGKSTSLSKICFFLLQNKYKVLVVACDTFRSGAVEQLAVHVKNLQELTNREGGLVQLYQKGYGKDAANVAKDAIAFSVQEAFDVVLIDTAGRRHNDHRLMSSLEKFAKFADPDKILMVGEALVGTDSVAQARNFNSAFGNGRMLDGFIISKCDTVGDMVGTLVSMVHATSVPVLFVGVGQHYSDLRSLSVKWAVDRLLSQN